MNIEKKLKALDRIKEDVNKKYGKGACISKEDNIDYSIPRWDLSSPILTDILGGGLPKGRVIEIYGAEGGGKTTTAIDIAANVQKQGGIVLFTDAEYAFDYERAGLLGLSCDSDKFRLSQPDHAEMAFGVIESHMKEVDLIIIDSVSALVPRAEVEGDFGESHMGLQARLMSQALRKLVGILATTETTLIFINQIRMKIGITWGSPETTSGGRALKFYSSIRLDVRRKENIKKGEQVTGIISKIKCVKNKTAVPYKIGERELDFKIGFNPFKEYVAEAVKYKIIDKAGSWYSYNGTKIGQGKDNVSLYLKDHLEIFNTIKSSIDNLLFPNLSSSDKVEKPDKDKEIKVRPKIKDKKELNK